MGSIATQDRCARFIDEFNDDAVRVHGPAGSFVRNQGLGIMESWNQVFLFVSVAGPEEGLDTPSTELMVPTIMFDPEEQANDLVERVCDLFELDEETARTRLKKAELL